MFADGGRPDLINSRFTNISMLKRWDIFPVTDCKPLQAPALYFASKRRDEMKAELYALLLLPFQWMPTASLAGAGTAAIIHSGAQAHPWGSNVPRPRCAHSATNLLAQIWRTRASEAPRAPDRLSTTHPSLGSPPWACQTPALLPQIAPPESLPGTTTDL
jgi:hypothetical protein